ASDLDAATRAQLDRGQRLTELMKQPQYKPDSLAQEVCTMYAAINGFMDDVPVDRIREFEERLIGYLETSKSEVMKSIEDTKDYDEATEASLKEGIVAFKATF
ncbi:MAG: F0F1 ATP synthase subunit alpha, partial [Chloroflexi bacterium]|nr:F0F1 ATP synthase subunit alpha [Chloroflexota bacterium]